MKRVLKSNSLRRSAGQARVGILMLVMLVVVLGLVAGDYWYIRAKQKNNPAASDSLSANTKAVLAQLSAPVEIRFYSLLDPASVPVAVQKFSGRVEQLLAAYAAAAPGKVTVTRFTKRSDDNVNAAARAGLKSFNLNQGDACYLGLTVAAAGQQEALAQLAPEWEPALESDLTRAILRVVSAHPAAPVFRATPPVDPITVEAVKQLVPDYATLTVEQGSQKLRAAGLAELQTAAKEIEVQLAAAHERLGQAQKGASEPDKKAALKELAQLQTKQTALMQFLAAKVQLQIAALEQLKQP